MQAVHNSYNEAGRELMRYLSYHNEDLDVDDNDYLSPFDFILEEVECKEVNEVITDFESARKALGLESNVDFELLGRFDKFDSIVQLISDINPMHIEALIALNELLTIAQAWNKEDVTAALWALRTKQKIEESFPEALPYLDFDDGKTNLPVPKYEELRNLLKKNR